jgi:DNA processing protein
MMLSNETKSLIHLSMIPGVGIQTIRALLQVFSSAQNALEATSQELAEVDGLGPQFCRRLTEGRGRVAIDREIQLIRTHNCRVITIHDEAYPPILKQVEGCPLLLYIKGELPPEDTLGIAVVGSRSPTEYGKTISSQLSHQLATHGVTVVSGLARGIDTYAHRGALEANGRTVAVLGNGLASVYPEENKSLVDEIVKDGALISEFPMTMKPKARNFPRRNCVMSGLTAGTLVVEASDRSGALITARFAAEQGREVFAVPGQIFSKLSRGTHRLINQGAHLVNTIDDILDAIPRHYLESVPRPSPSDHPEERQSLPSRKGEDDTVLTNVPKPAPTPQLQLSTDERTVLDAVAAPHSHIDEIARTTQLPINKVSGILVMLELKGAVQQLPGKQFAKK